MNTLRRKIYNCVGNSTTTRVMRKGNILRKFISGELLSLSNVLYVLFLRRNLVFGVLLNKAGLKTIVRDEKVIISHNGVFVGRDT